MADLLRIEGLTAKKEGTYGTDPTPATGDSVRFNGRLWPMLEVSDHFENRRDDAVSGTLISPKRGVVAGGLGKLSLPWEMKGKGAAYAVEGDIEANPLIQACGYGVAVVTTSNVEKLTYTPADTGHASATLWPYAGGLLYKLLGCRGNLKWPINAGGLGNLMFEMTGMMPADPATTAVVSPTYDSSLPPVAKGMAITVNAGGDVTFDVLDAEFDLGNRIEIVEDANGTDGLQSIEIVERAPKLTITVRKEPLSTYDPYALLKAVTSHTVAWTLGSAQYNRAKLAISEAYLAQKPERVDYRGFAGYKLTFDVKAHTIVFD